jgi:hypothetical protein
MGALSANSSSVKSEPSGKPKMVYKDQKWLSTKEIKDDIRDKLMTLLNLPGFPYFNGQMYTEDGQPYYSTFMSKGSEYANAFLEEGQLVKLTESKDHPRRVANHLYADGPMRVSLEACEGITDLKWFINADLND